MKRFPKHLVALSVAAMLLAPATALSEPGQHKNKHKHKHHAPPVAAWQHERDWRDHRRHDNGRHLGWYKQQWRRGQRVPVVYLQPRYVIEDYRSYRLAPPPPGYGWVRPYPNSDEYLMVQLATGLIAQVLGY